MQAIELSASSSMCRHSAFFRGGIRRHISACDFCPHGPSHRGDEPIFQVVLHCADDLRAEEQALERSGVEIGHPPGWGRFSGDTSVGYSLGGLRSSGHASRNDRIGIVVLSSRSSGLAV